MSECICPNCGFKHGVVIECPSCGWYGDDPIEDMTDEGDW